MGHAGVAYFIWRTRPIWVGLESLESRPRRADKVMSMPSGKQPEPGPLSRAFAARVQSVMDDGGVTISALAIAAGLSRNYLGKRLRNEAPFTFNDAEAICSALGMEPPRI